MHRVLAAFSCFTAVVLAGCSSPADESRRPDLIVINADVRTVDPAAATAQAFAVTGGRFSAVGTNEDIHELAGEATTVIDAGGVTVLPGLVDGHTHLLGGAGLAVGVDLSGIEDKQEWLRIVRRKADRLPEGEWILGGGWDHNLSDGVLPTREMLDEVAPAHPVLLDDIDGHSAWANSLAIELAGITARSAAPAGGEIVVDPETGEPSGIFKETAGRLFNDAPGLGEATDPVAGLTAAVALANSLGLTTVHDMSGNSDAFLALLDDGKLTLRVWQGIRPAGGDERAPAEIYAGLAAERARVRERVAADPRVAGAGPLFEIGYTKLIIDGVLSTHTALMQAPYTDEPAADPVPFVPKDRLNALIAAAHDHGFPVAVHAIGDEGVSWVLDGFAASPAAVGGPPDRIEHVEVVTPGDVERFRHQGVAASMQPHHATCCVGNYVIERIGRERLDNAYNWRAMLDHGVALVLGSDWPTSPFNPLVQLADTLHRETRIDGVVRPWDEGRTLTFDEALYAYTQAGANMTAWGDEIGSISPGKWADFVMLDERLAEPVDRSIESRRVTQTWLAGRRVFGE